jgi:hypothetical protein
MHQDNIHNTTFRTHRGHFEFLVMPFILKFVLVFFDDILIFSNTWTKHLQHVKQVLQVLRGHKLFLKQFKCSFGEESVVYLGHIISAAGVAMDLANVTAVEEWPRP